MQYATGAYLSHHKGDDEGSQTYPTDVLPSCLSNSIIYFIHKEKTKMPPKSHALCLEVKKRIHVKT